MALDRSAEDSACSRREFLERTAYAAGLAGAAGLLGRHILAEAAEAPLVRGCPSRATCRSTTSSS